MLVLTVALVVGLVGGYVTGGSMRNMERLELRLPWLVLVAIAVQFAIFSPLGAQFGDHAVVGAHLASYGLLLLFVVLNIHYGGIAIAGAGIAMNALVIVLNHGYMPASARALEIAGLQESVHNNSAVAGAGSRLLALGDVFAAPSWLPLFANVFSVGDVSIALGVAFLIMTAMRPAKVTEAA